jgi:enoyl-CoA hydratase/carnithine racemase
MITLEVSGGIAVATLSRPPVNAIDEEWISRLNGIVARCEADPAVSVLLVRSDQKTFSAGADLALMRSRFDSDEGRRKMIAFVREMQRVYARIEASRLVSIAEIGGAAMGGGLELALACDLRIASESAKLGLPEARLGLLPGAGGTQRLSRLCGEATAKRLILGAEVVDASEAARLGIVHRVSSKENLEREAREMAEQVARLPAHALAACKRCIEAAREPGDRGYELELSGTLELLASAETQARVRAFLGKGR